MNTARIKTPSDWQAMGRQERLEYMAGQLRRMADLIDSYETEHKIDRNTNGNTIAIKIKVKS